MDISVGILWPVTQDFPLFRYRLCKIRKYFSSVNIYFTNNYSGKLIDDFVKDSLKGLDINFFYAEKPLVAGEDWASVAFNRMIKETKSEWFMSIHPDIFFKDWDKLFTTLEEKQDEFDLIGNPYSGKNISPSFFLIKRKVLEKTSLDIGAHSGYDHWGLISKEVLDMGKEIKTLKDIGFELGKDYIHLSGISQDWENGLLPEYKFPDPEKFLAYLTWSIKAPVPFDMSWLLTTRFLMTRLYGLLPNFDPNKYSFGEPEE